MVSRKENVEKYLVEHGIKPSFQRISIMDYLRTHPTHPSVETIYNDLSPRIPTLSKTTVYNTLKLFVEHGAALMLTIDEKTTHFDGDLSSHAHFFCLGCGQIYDIEMDASVRERASESDLFTITETHLYYKGYCRKCCEKSDK
ncbi:MAG: transcriptional repressor [Paludibacteraceae bacterium]|nr:transcriptional repressor [Paludibacteraceae bacterium]